MTTLRRAGIPVAVAIGCSILFFAASLATTFVDKAAVRAHVSVAFKAGETHTPEHNWHHNNHCLVLFMLLAPYDTRVQEALLPKVPQREPCQNLQAMAETGGLGDFYTYERYWHGIRTIVAPLVSRFEIDTAITILRTAGALLLALAFGALVWRRRHDTQSTPSVGVGLALVGCLSLFYIAPPYYGTYLAFWTSDLTVYVLVAVAVLVNLATLSLPSMVALASLLGAAIAYLEWLTGQAPLGLTALLALTAAAAHAGSADLVRRFAWTAYAFVVGFGLTVAAKIAALLVVGAGSGYFVPMLLHRMGGAGSGHRFGIDLSQHAMYSPHTLLVALLELGAATKTLGRGSLALGLSVVLLGLAGLAVGGWLRWRRLPERLERTRTLALVAAALVMPAWYVIFLNHTIFHAPFMIRPLVGLIAIGLWLGATELARVAKPAWRGRASFRLALADKSASARP
jgi:hypothetical protein